MLNDLNHYWGSDLQPGPTGDLGLASGTLRGQQRVLRRLLTNPGDYVFEPTYGAGLPRFVGQTVDPAKVVAVIRSQLMLEPSVAKLPVPQITVRQLATDATGLTVTIAYNDAAGNQPVVLSFNVAS